MDQCALNDYTCTLHLPYRTLPYLTLPYLALPYTVPWNIGLCDLNSEMYRTLTSIRLVTDVIERIWDTHTANG